MKKNATAQSPVSGSKSPTVLDPLDTSALTPIDVAQASLDKHWQKLVNRLDGRVDEVDKARGELERIGALAPELRRRRV